MKGAERGFTLIELMVVIAIISVVALIVVPRLPSTESSKLQNSARSVAAGIRLLTDRTVTTKSSYRLRLNLADSTLTIVRMTATGDEAPPEDPLLARHLIAEGILIEDVLTERLGKVSEGEVILRFGAAGLAEFTVIHLKNRGGEQYTVTAYPNSGKVTAMPGYLEAAQ